MLRRPHPRNIWNRSHHKTVCSSFLLTMSNTWNFCWRREGRTERRANSRYQAWLHTHPLTYYFLFRIVPCIPRYTSIPCSKPYLVHTLLLEQPSVLFSKYRFLSRLFNSCCFQSISKDGFGTATWVGFITLHFKHLRFEHPNTFNHPHDSRGKSQVFQGLRRLISVYFCVRKIANLWACFSKTMGKQSSLSSVIDT